MTFFSQPAFISTSLLTFLGTKNTAHSPFSPSFNPQLSHEAIGNRFNSAKPNTFSQLPPLFALNDPREPLDQSRLSNTTAINQSQEQAITEHYGNETQKSQSVDAPPTRISTIMNQAPMWVKAQINQAALDVFKGRCAEKGTNFDDMQRLAEQRLAARNNTTLAKLSDSLILPDYYLSPVHIPMDGINNGYTSAIQAPAAHEGLYVNNEAIRATTYDPAIQSIQELLKSKTECRILFAGSGFGGDAVDFLARAQKQAPEILPKLNIDLIDLSPHFLDVGADEIPYQLNNLGIPSGPFKRVTVIEPGKSDGEKFKPNEVNLGYSVTNSSLANSTGNSTDSVIKNLHLMDISAPDFIQSLNSKGVDGYDIIFCLYVFHEMPEARIRATMDNFIQLVDKGNLYFQDMDYDKKIGRMQQEGLQGQLKSFMLAQVFSGTEPYSQSPPSQEIPHLLAEYGDYTEFNQTDIVRDEATIQAGVIKKEGPDPLS